MSQRSETVTQLLERYDEYADPRQAGNGGNKTGLALMPHAKHCAIHHTRDVKHMRTNDLGVGLVEPCTCHLAHYQEIDRLLTVMVSERRSQWWHVTQRYLRCEYTQKQVRFVRGKPIGVVTGRGPSEKVQPLGAHQATVIGASVNWEAALAEQRRKRAQTPHDYPVMVASWNPAVRMQKVRLGVDWIADSWALQDAPALPAEKLVAA